MTLTALADTGVQLCLGGRDTMQRLGLDKTDLLRRAWMLKAEYGLKVRETDCQGVAASLASRDTGRQLVAAYIAQQLEEVLAGEGEVGAKVRSSYTRLLHLCDLGGVVQEEGVARLVLELARVGLHQPALQVSAEHCWSIMMQLIITLYGASVMAATEHPF